MIDWERAICARVKTVRESINWSQAAFAAQLGITRDKLASIEYGRTPLRYEIAWRLRHAFGISLRWLDDGFNFPDNSERDNLPIPVATGLPARALLSLVAHTFSVLGDERLVAIGPDVERPASGLHKTRNPESLSSSAASMMAALNEVLDGREATMGRTDIGHRDMCAGYLRHRIDDWISRVPLGHVAELCDQLEEAAKAFIKSFPPDTDEAIGRRSDDLMWARIKAANAGKFLVASQAKKRLLTDVIVTGNISPVKSTMANLLDRLNKTTSLRGMKSKLAKVMGVPLSNVSQWLSGAREPGGETTLRLLEWVQAEEAKQPKSPGSAQTPPERKTQLSKSYYEKTKSSHQKR
jgi:transcriptional regulator with XRE-family HTH domain